MIRKLLFTVAFLISPVSAYAQDLLTGLEAHYTFDADGNDSHTNTLNLSANNTPAFVTGKIGNAVDLESSDGDNLTHVNDSHFTFTDEDFGIIVWVNAESYDNGSGNTIIAKYDFSIPSREYVLHYSNVVDRYVLRVSDDGAGTNATNGPAGSYGSPNSGDVGEWHMIYCGHDSGNQIEISIDGGDKETTAYTHGVNGGTSVFCVGAFFNGSAGVWDGLIDNTSIYRRTLSDAEIDLHWNGGAGLAYADFGGEEETTVTGSFFLIGQAKLAYHLYKIGTYQPRWKIGPTKMWKR